MWVPLETPRQEEFDKKSSSPPTRSLGTETPMELGSHWTGTAHRTVFLENRMIWTVHNESDILTLTAAFVISKRQTPRTVTVIGVFPRGASMTTASIHMIASRDLYTQPQISTTHEYSKILPTHIHFSPVFLPLQLFRSTSSTLPGPHSHLREPFVLMQISAQPPFSFSHSFTSVTQHTRRPS